MLSDSLIAPIPFDAAQTVARMPNESLPPPLFCVTSVTVLLIISVASPGKTVLRYRKRLSRISPFSPAK